MDKTGVSGSSPNSVIVDRHVMAMALKAAMSPTGHTATSCDSAAMIDADTARVSIYNFGTHETSTYEIVIPTEFTARKV